MTKHKFQYIAKSYSDGSEHRGTVEAVDRNAAIAAIRADGLMPTALGQILEKPTICKQPVKNVNILTLRKFLRILQKQLMCLQIIFDK